MIDFLIANPFIYDKSLREYKVTAAKTAKWEQLAKDLGVDHFGLIKWYESMRTMYGRITSLCGDSLIQDCLPLSDTVLYKLLQSLPQNIKS